MGVGTGTGTHQEIVLDAMNIGGRAVLGRELLGHKAFSFFGNNIVGQQPLLPRFLGL